jgi:formylglycine-generating enzyme required for sulfatase activity
VRVAQSGIDEMVGTVRVSKPVTLNASLASFKTVFEKVDPKNEARALILCDWAATHNDLRGLFRASYEVIAPKPEDAFLQARSGLIRYEQIHEQAKEQICVNPNCAFELRSNSETFCKECGGQLRKADISAWAVKYVEPIIKEDPRPSESVRSRLIDTAVRMGIDVAQAVTSLAGIIEYNKPKAPVLTDANKITRRSTVSRTIRGLTKKETVAPAAAAETDPKPAAAAVPPIDGVLIAERKKPDWSNYSLKALVCVLLLVIAGIFFPWKKVEKGPIVDGLPSPIPAASPMLHPHDANTPSGMTKVIGAHFMMGAADNTDRYQGSPHPEHVESFYIDETEVTREEYKKCIDDQHKCEVPYGWNGSNYPLATGQYPATGVNWNDARKYCEWAQKRLPTELEWEFAARGGGSQSKYPWGSTWLPNRANLASNDLKPVRSYEAESSLGLFDMIGNAWEWTSSEALDYATKSYLRTGRGIDVANLRIVRGGCHLSSTSMTATFRAALLITKERNSYAQTGFRCVLPVTVAH